MDNEQDFLKALKDKKIPILVLDQKWHRLFAIHGKTDAIKTIEEELNAHLMRQGELNTRLKELKRLKNQLMDNIVANMKDVKAEDKEQLRQKKLDKDKSLIDDINEQMEACEDELLELPKKIQETNRRLMLESMDYCYAKLRVNQKESEEIEAWINQIRVELKKNIIRKQNRDINNREIYAYMHDIFGPDILDLFDIKNETDTPETEEETEADTQNKTGKEDDNS